MKIVYYYLNKLFNCYFTFGNIKEFIFNPELIKLLFGNAQQFYMHNCYLAITYYNIGKSLQFIINNLKGRILTIKIFPFGGDIEKYINILFKILTNGGDNFEEVNVIFITNPVLIVDNVNIPLIVDNGINYIATTRDCSIIVPVSILHYESSASLKLSERAKKVELEESHNMKIYKLSS
uniref:Uncharacterized protein n=1 Tax=Meloidogyne enterolobii TaxID=390850 RepID=A0A6V7VTR5_MELEN|nr:unnamed protein product [Meloidogyne enterolobii]